LHRDYGINGPFGPQKNCVRGLDPPHRIVPLQVGIDTGIFCKHGLEIERADLGGAARALRPSQPGALTCGCG